MAIDNPLDIHPQLGRYLDILVTLFKPFSFCGVNKKGPLITTKITKIGVFFFNCGSNHFTFSAARTPDTYDPLYRSDGRWDRLLSCLNSHSLTYRYLGVGVKTGGERRDLPEFYFPSQLFMEK